MELRSERHYQLAFRFRYKGHWGGGSHPITDKKYENGL